MRESANPYPQARVEAWVGPAVFYFILFVRLLWYYIGWKSPVKGARVG
jgi:hypothetical protein